MGTWTPATRNRAVVLEFSQIARLSGIEDDTDPSQMPGRVGTRAVPPVG
jgi:hypothetical protein